MELRGRTTRLWGPLALLLASVANVATLGCAVSENRALVLLTVKVKVTISAVKTLTFTRDNAPAGEVTTAPIPPELKLGFYVSQSKPKAMVTITARALNDGGCIIGEGSVMVAGIAPGKTVDGGELNVTPSTTIVCLPDGGTPDGGTTDGPRDGSGGDVPDGGLPNGQACANGLSCAQGHCVDGVCCDIDCTGQCSACNEPNNVGKCVAVSGAPRGTRTRCGGTAPCNATCDGTDGVACKYPRSTVVCSAGSCQAGAAKTASTCDGAGACTTATSVPCESNQCADPTKCSGGCSATSPCPMGAFCDPTGVCIAAKNNGDTCQTGAECKSTFCADSVCCNSACTGQCQACRETTSVGTCVTVAGSPRGARPGCAGSQASCAGRCDGVAPSACVYPDSTTVCAPATCSGGSMMVAASTCNGAGTCPASTPTPCGSGTYCTGGACVTQTTEGGACQTGAQCQSGNCSNGTCCASGRTACNGVCRTLTTDSQHCGMCGKVCPAGSCSGGMLTGASTCSGGQCSTPSASPCMSGQCANATSCTGACSASSCGSGKYCDTASGVCQPAKSNGVPCQSAGQCASGACVDGVCCASACGGQCQSCNEPSMAGMCVTVTGTPRGSRPVCAGTQATCAGTCNGTSGTSCSYPGASAVCAAAQCSGTGSLTPATVCNGAGACTTAMTAPCASGRYCTNNACVMQTANGGSCTTAAQCQSGNCTGAVCCATGQTGCGGVCRNLTNDANNCGACAMVCPGVRCQGGVLLGATTCSSGNCVGSTMTACPSGACQNSTTCVPPPPAAVVQWRFERQSTASNLIDSSGGGTSGRVLHGNALDSPVFATPAFTADRRSTSNGALALDGTTSQAWAQFEATNSLNAPWSANAITVTMWLRPKSIPASGGNCLFDRGLGVDATAVKLWFFNGRVEGTVKNFLVSHSGTLPLNQWAFVAMTYNGDDLLLYVNGTQVSTFTNLNTPLVTSTSPVTIGSCRNTTGGYVTGYANVDFDEVRLYSAALSAGQIGVVMNQ